MREIGKHRLHFLAFYPRYSFTTPPMQTANTKITSKSIYFLFYIRFERLPFLFRTTNMQIPIRILVGTGTSQRIES